MGPMQTTLRSSVSFSGIGLHSGQQVRISVRPQRAGIGIWFTRTDRSAATVIQARYDRVPPGRLCTRLQGHDTIEISTVEHVMAALAGCGIHNALIEVDGPEVPILDGSAAPFVRAFLQAGLREQRAPLHAIEILSEVGVCDGDASARLTPADGFMIDFEIEFADKAIGRQRSTANMANGRFVRDFCDSRTFCRQTDVDAMRRAGLALGGSYDNAVVVDGARVLSPGGLRHKDEAVRHKVLDALGGLALSGAPILGRYTGVKAGHMVTNQLLRKLFSSSTAYRVVTCTPAQAARLPGVGVTISDLAHVA